MEGPTGIEPGETDFVIRGVVLEHDDYPGLRVSVDVTTSGRVCRFDVTGDDVTARLLRRLPLGELADVARRHAIEEAQRRAKRGEVVLSMTFDDGTVGRARLLDLNFVGDLGRRPGRAGRPDIQYAQLAEQYDALLTAGRQPVPEMAEAMHLSESQVRNLVNEARRRGLLTKGTKGRARGQLTAEARRLLSGEHRQES